MQWSDTSVKIFIVFLEWQFARIIVFFLVFGEWEDASYQIS